MSAELLVKEIPRGEREPLDLWAARMLNRRPELAEMPQSERLELLAMATHTTQHMLAQQSELLDVTLLMNKEVQHYRIQTPQGEHESSLKWARRVSLKASLWELDNPDDRYRLLSAITGVPEGVLKDHALFKSRRAPGPANPPPVQTARDAAARRQGRPGASQHEWP